MTEIRYFLWDRPIVEAAAALLELCRSAFDPFDDDYLLSRLPVLVDPMLWVAEDASGWIGFKLGYRRGTTLYSWLGAVHPQSRGKGVASELMIRQHEAGWAAGFAHVETRTRATNNRMVMLNLRHGLNVCGYEVDTRGFPVVTLRKSPA